MPEGKLGGGISMCGGSIPGNGGGIIAPEGKGGGIMPPGNGGSGIPPTDWGIPMSGTPRS